MRGITKRFPGVVANERVDFEAAAGEVHALLGENGAGKSTLSNIVTGLYRPDEGSLELHGEPVDLHAPRDALARGVGMVHQHFRLVQPFTICCFFFAIAAFVAAVTLGPYGASPVKPSLMLP